MNKLREYLNVNGASFLIGSVLIHLIILGGLYATGLLDSDMSANQAKLAKEAEKRKLQQKKKSPDQRKKQRISEDHAERLKREKERTRRRRAVKRIQRVEEYLQKIQEAKELRVRLVENRNESQIKDDLIARIRSEARTLDREMQQFRYEGEERDRLRTRTQHTRESAEALFASSAEEMLRDQLVESTGQTFALAQSNAEAEVDAELASLSLGLPEDIHIFNLTKRLKELVDRLLDPQKNSPEWLNDLQNLSDDSRIEKAAVGQMTTAELYERGQMLEREVARQYTEVRTLDRALADVTSFDEARQDVNDPVQPNRPDLNSRLNQDVDTVGELSDFRQAVNEFDREVANIERRTRSLAFQIAGIELDSDSAALRALRQRNALNLAASQSHGGYIDLTQFMQGNGAGPGQGADQEFKIEGEGGRHMAKVDPVRGVRLPREQILAQALPARHFSSSAERKGWLYLDTWYMIGPWENDGAVTYDRRHPPEIGIDFDAVYANGKGGNELSWQFLQSNNIRVIPPQSQRDATYYFYTEAEFDETVDLYVAIASDDATKVWLNDQIVWQENGLSQWNIGEGMRKVTFRKGTNRILVRLENGPGETMFSLLLCPTEAIEN